jgi:phosphoribosylformylglycinamidine synthase
MKAKIEVMLKPGVFDPQGKVLMNALHHLDYASVKDVRAAKLFYIEIDEATPDAAKKKLDEMADELFANPVIENYHIEITS